jgi:DNA-binding NarL/FixJ family response regulator
MARDLVGWALGSGSRPAAPVTVLVDPDDTHWSQVDGSAVVVVTSDPVGPGRAAELVLRGADAVVTVDAGVEAVRAAVRGVGAGGTLLDPVVARLVVDAARSACAATPGTAPNLSPREAEILGCIARGMSVKQTARTLGVAHKTVENLQGRLFRKLGARNRAQAVARAADLGLLDVLAG